MLTKNEELKKAILDINIREMYAVHNFHSC